jgi:hypothetical protein
MMAVDAGDRQQLRERLEATLGERPAEVLMGHLFDEGASEVGTRLAGLDLRLVEMGERMDAMDLRLVEMGERMDAMLVLFEQRFDAMDRRFDGLETRFDGLETRMESVEERLGRMEPRLGKVEDRIHTLQNTMLTSFLVITFSSWGLVLAAMALA